MRHSKTLGFAAVVTVAICMVTAMGGILRAKSRKLAIAKTQQNWQDFESEFQTAQIRFVETPLAPSAALETTREHLQMLLGRCESLEQNLAYLNRSQQNDYEHRRADLKFLDNLTTQLLDGRPQTQLPRHKTGGETRLLLSPVRKRCQDACFQLSQRRFRESLVNWQAALQLAPRNVWIWYGQASCWEHLDAADRAAECYSACIALNPEFFGWYFNRARMHLTAGHLELALQDLRLAWERNPEHAPTAANLAICHLTRECPEPAIVWIKRAERLGYDETLVCLLMAKALRLSDAFSRAERWETLAVESTPTSCNGWVARGNLKTTDAPADALRDFQKGLTLNRYSREAWENCAFVLSERLDRTGDALKTLDHAIELFPECAVLVASRGVLHARQGFSAEALRDADRAMRYQPSPEVLYRVACIESLLAGQGAGDESTAFALLKQSLSAGFGVEFFQSDPDLLPLHDRKEFADLSHAIASLNLLPQ